MHTTEKQLLEFITRLAYNIDGLPGKLKLYFSQFLAFHFSNSLSLSQIQDIENRRASKPFHNITEIENAASGFSFETKIWIVASIQILQLRAEEIDDRVVSRRISRLLEELVDALKLKTEAVKIQEEKKRIEDKLYQFHNRPVVQIPTAIWPLSLDYSIRWLLLLSFSYFGYDKDYLAVYNILLIPIFIQALVYWIGRTYRKANQKLLDGYGGQEKFIIRYDVRTGQYTELAVFLGTSLFISYLLFDQLQILSFFGLLLYYFFYLRYFRIGRLKENDLVKQLESENLITNRLSVDENDEVIVALETKLNSSTSRLEAYVLESALFGALSFSGFLQIMATELITFKDLENFAHYIFSSAQAFIHLDWPTYYEGLAGLSTKASLFCLVSVESLICSIFFLAVIASRLRFSDIADRVRTAINMAKAYNEKEESLHDEQEITSKKMGRLEALTAKVNTQLHEANIILSEIAPVMSYMEYFRNAGILVFVVILISSSLFITGALGWIFIGLVVATYVYFNRIFINEQLKTFLLYFRIRFIELGFWLFTISIVPFLLAYILKIFFHIQGTYWLFSLSTVLVCLYVFIWLILAAHVDESFGEIEMDIKRQKRWRFVKNSVGVLILLFGIASAFKMNHLMGANEMLMISLMSLSVLMYFVGYYLTKVRWLGIFCGGIIAITCTGLCFKVLHLDGANEMILIGMIALFILIPLILWKRNLFHKLFVRFCIVALMFGVWYDPLTYKIPLALEVAYANETLDIARILPVVENNFQHNLLTSDDQVFDRGVALSDWYMKEYGTKLGFNKVYELLIGNYDGFAYQILFNPKSDTTMLRKALKTTQQVYKILELFDFTPYPDNTERFEMEAEILLKLGKKDEAIQSLEKLLTKNIPDNVRDILVNKLADLKNPD